MAKRSNHSLQRLATQTAELAFAAPQVMQHRLTRMAFAGAFPSERDSKEFRLMKDEKVAAFNQSWQAMWLHAWQSQMSMATSICQACWFPWMYGSRLSSLPATFVENMTHGVLAKGMAPVHRRAVSNAKRLARLKAG